MTATSITRAGIVAKRGLLAASEHLERLASWLTDHRIEPVYETDTATLSTARGQGATWSRDDLPNHVDLIIVLGGDGTLLSMATRIARTGRDVPMLGVNFGSLGFLTETRIDEMYPTLESVVAGTAKYEERALLSADAYRAREHFDSRVVLNDVVFAKAALSRIIELSVSVSTGLVTRVKADGLIVASATGSTAYNLAAGGPIVHPRVDALMLTPIAPHTLTHRPIVIPGTEVVEVRPHPDAGVDDVYVTYDGQFGYPLQKGDSVRIRKHERMLRLVKAQSRSYFEVLREKLKWGER
ncbi:MAG TPA: NAD(+)/NADH kinase [Vicinamibacterales bacterium]|nr:NAD(+)/NADH kinase [Vicinamibacterales bacterium]